IHLGEQLVSAGLKQFAFMTGIEPWLVENILHFQSKEGRIAVAGGWQIGQRGEIRRISDALCFPFYALNERCGRLAVHVTPLPNSTALSLRAFRHLTSGGDRVTASKIDAPSVLRGAGRVIAIARLE